MIHGSSPSIVNDLDPGGVPQAPAQPGEDMAWRPAFEHEILASSDVLDVMILAAHACLWRSRANVDRLPFPHSLGTAYQEPKSPAVELPCKVDSLVALIHVLDVAEAVRLAVSKLQVFSNADISPVFDLVSSFESMALILTGFARLLGFTNDQIRFRVPKKLDAVTLPPNTLTNTTSELRGADLLGWQPKRVGMAQAIETHARAWLARLERPRCC